MEWTTVEAVKSFSGLSPADTFDDAALAASVAAVNAWLDQWGPVVGLVSAPTDPPTDPVPLHGSDFGATMLANRLYTGRNSPQGIASFSEMGGATYVSRYLDLQTQMLLRMGDFTPGRVG